MPNILVRDLSQEAIDRIDAAAVKDEWSARISRGLVRLSTISRLDLGYSAR